MTIDLDKTSLFLFFVVVVVLTRRSKIGITFPIYRYNVDMFSFHGNSRILGPDRKQYTA